MLADYTDHRWLGGGRTPSENFQNRSPPLINYRLNVKSVADYKNLTCKNCYIEICLFL